MIKQIFSITAAIFLCSCNDGDFINHTLVAEKAGSCASATGEFKMVSNTSGQRYTFDLCLDAAYTVKNYSVMRNADTIMVIFPQVKSGDASALYNLTLDIDAKPRYNFIKLGDKLIAVIAGGY
jgi:hypothetical protein